MIGIMNDENKVLSDEYVDIDVELLSENEFAELLESGGDVIFVAVEVEDEDGGEG